MAEAEWIEWSGGECPVDAETPVEVLFRNGNTTDAFDAGEFDSDDLGLSNWQHGEPYPHLDIVAYRLVLA